jgi:hypothetical protein
MRVTVQTFDEQVKHLFAIGCGQPLQTTVRVEVDAERLFVADCVHLFDERSIDSPERSGGEMP